MRTFSRFTLHLSDEDVAELDRRIVAVLDEFVSTDEERREHPRYSGIFLLHRPPGAAAGTGTDTGADTARGTAAGAAAGTGSAPATGRSGTAADMERGADARRADTP